MLLQKTGWRIKQFISHRRNSSLDNTDNDIKERYKGVSASASNSRRGSWLSQNPQDTSALRRASISTTRSPRSPPHTTTTAHSSASSLCSCDCGSSHSTVNPLSEAPTTKVPEILYLPPLPLSTTSSDADTWRLIFSEPPSRPPLLPRSARIDEKPPLPTSPGSEATFNILEALAIDLVDHDKTPTQSIRNSEEFSMENFSDGVDQLIRETDEAFQAVGIALADAKAATHSWYDTTVKRSRETSHSGSVEKPNSLISTKPQISRSKSIVKVRRKPFYRRKGMQFAKAVPKIVAPSNTPERWNLTDVTTNLVDVFSGKIFKTEVDEMLTPGRIEQLKNEMRGDSPKISLESSRSIESNSSTPTEPFYLESLSASVDANTEVEKQRSSPTPPPIPPKSEARNMRAKSDKKNTEDTMSFEDLSFPSPPRKSTRPSRGPALPTIPERSAPPILTDNKEESSSERQSDSSEFITLPSTPFTLTSPLFRHGAIRIERKVPEPPEEALDWTAFQMAILGTMEEQSDTSADMEWEFDEAEADETTRWFLELGFEGPGALIREPRSKEVKGNRGRKKSLKGEDSEKMLVEGDLKYSRDWGLQLEDVASSSLPSSPMPDIAPSEEDEDTVIPMGHNLGHDLGDFLNWEAQHIQSLYEPRHSWKYS